MQQARAGRKRPYMRQVNSEYGLVMTLTGKLRSCRDEIRFYWETLNVCSDVRTYQNFTFAIANIARIPEIPPANSECSCRSQW